MQGSRLRMTCTILGPGLVGCYLGAAADAATVVVGPSDRIKSDLVRLPAGLRSWRPRLVALADCDPSTPLLVCSRAHLTPWVQLPGQALCAQNGLGQPRPVAVCFFAVDLTGGMIHATGTDPRIVVGPLPAAWSPVLSAWRSAGLIVEQVADVSAARWEKAVLNATVGPLCVATGLGMAAVWRDHRDLVLGATAEGLAIAAAELAAIGAPGIADGALDRAAAFFAAVGDHRPSAVVDRGELPWLFGPLAVASRRHGIPAPSLETISRMTGCVVTTAQVDGRHPG